MKPGKADGVRTYLFLLFLLATVPAYCQRGTLDLNVGQVSDKFGDLAPVTSAVLDVNGQFTVIKPSPKNGGPSIVAGGEIRVPSDARGVPRAAALGVARNADFASRHDGPPFLRGGLNDRQLAVNVEHSARDGRQVAKLVGDLADIQVEGPSLTIGRDRGQKKQEEQSYADAMRTSLRRCGHDPPCRASSIRFLPSGQCTLPRIPPRRSGFGASPAVNSCGAYQGDIMVRCKWSHAKWVASVLWVLQAGSRGQEFEEFTDGVVKALRPPATRGRLRETKLYEPCFSRTIFSAFFGRAFPCVRRRRRRGAWAGNRSEAPERASPGRGLYPPPPTRGLSVAVSSITACRG